MGTPWLRTRQFLNRYFIIVVVVCLGLALLGGWLTYETHADPGTSVERQQVSSWSSTPQVDHEATVHEQNPVYPVGTTLENRTAYFSSVAPELDVTTAYQYAASETGDLTVTADTWLEFQRVSTDRMGNVETVYWKTTRDLGRDQVAALGPGERLRATHTINVSKLANESEQVDAALGQTRGQTRALVHTTFDVNGTVNGNHVHESERATLPIDVDDVYTVDAPETESRQFTSTREVAVANTFGPLRQIGAPLLLAVSLVSLCCLTAGRRLGVFALPAHEREYLAYQDDRSDFDEWINAIGLPDRVANSPRAEADSLADLVDFAIDTNNSVIEDPRTGAYHVLDDGFRFTYEPPAPPERDVLDRSEDDSAEPADELDDGHSSVNGQQDGDEVGPPDPVSADSENMTD